jgi:hypothetical protein
LAKPGAVSPVKFFVAVLWAPAAPLGSALESLRSFGGETDFAGPEHAFDSTDYYEPEMGGGLRRRLVSFSKLRPPDSLCAAKLSCNEIEDRLAAAKGRTVNLDVGYLDHNKIVLASCKGAGQKIYLGQGVWADLIGRYRDGRYCPFEWTFPDFRDGRYDSELGEMRRIYLGQLRNL